jgi:peptide/nickel transport system permease protein
VAERLTVPAMPAPAAGLWFAIGRLVSRRLLTGLATLAALSALVFAATQALPGDAATQVLGPHASVVQVADMRQRLGLDRPVAVQYLAWISGLARGDFGQSLANGAPVREMLAPRIQATSVLVLVAACVAIPFALVMGVWTATRRDRAVDLAASFATLALAAVPEFVVGIVLVILFATGPLQWLPPVSLIDPSVPLLDQADAIALPSLTLILASTPYVLRMMRASMIEVLDSDYIAMARLNGIPELRIVLRHALRNAIGPAIQVIALTLIYLAGGVVVVESVFNYPGIGTALVDAVRYRDLPVVQFLSLVIASVYVVCNLAADIAVILVTPRLRTTL